MPGRWTVGAAVGAIALMAPVTASAAAPGPHSPVPAPQQRAADALGLQTTPAAAPGERPRSANPYLSLLPDPTKADYIGWRRILETAGDERAQRLRTRSEATSRPPLAVDDVEPAGERGDNDTVPTAQRVRDFGTGRHDNPRAHVQGALAPEHVETTDLPRGEEDHQ